MKPLIYQGNRIKIEKMFYNIIAKINKRKFVSLKIKDNLCVIKSLTMKNGP